MTTFPVSHLPFFTSFNFSFVHVKEMENQTTRTQGQYMYSQVVLPILVNPQVILIALIYYNKRTNHFHPYQFLTSIWLPSQSIFAIQRWVRMANFNF